MSEVDSPIREARRARTACSPIRSSAPVAFLDELPLSADALAIERLLGRRIPQPASQQSALYMASKRAIDIVAAASLLIVLSPLLALLAILIKLEDGGPILYHQVRVGKDGRTFRFYKLRSMVRDADRLREALKQWNEADGPLFKMRDDPRITRVGRWMRRFSVDELPQLVSVLCGEMSLVGPRPHLPSEVESYSVRQRQRLFVQPGLLCLREISGRSHLTFEQWIELDLFYISHRSARLDLWILLRTLPAVLRAEGAY